MAAAITTGVTTTNVRIARPIRAIDTVTLCAVIPARLIGA